MPYSYHSSNFLLPANIGDYFDPEEEKRLVDIIDRALKEVLRYQTPGKQGTGIVQEGVYSCIFVNNDSYVELSPTQSLPAVFGFIKSIPIYSSSTIKWWHLENNRTYYLYLTLVEDRTGEEELSSRRFGHVDAIASLTQINDNSYLLVAIATTTSTSISLVTNPEGKLVLYSVSDYDKDLDGVIDNTKLLDGQSLEYILDRSHHIGFQDWETIDTDVHKVSTGDLAPSERVSLRLQEIFGSYSISGDLPETSSDLTHEIPSQVVSVNGIRIVTSKQTHRYVVERDTYVEVDTDGLLYFTEALRNQTPPDVASDRYRLFKVITEQAESATGKVIIQRQPSVGDEVKIGSWCYIAVSTEVEALGSSDKFWIGDSDTSDGWNKCAFSLSQAINNSACPVKAVCSLNTVAITYETPGEIGNVEIEVECTRVGDITAFGLSDGHSDCIIEVVDLRKSAIPYWTFAVDTYDALPSVGVDGEVKLVKEENTLYRYSTDLKKGTGVIKFLDTPEHGDRLLVGEVVVTATSGVSDIELKEFSIQHSLSSLKDIINFSTYPFSQVTALVEDDSLILSSDKNYEIKLLVGNENNYYLSGIAGADEKTGWISLTLTSGIQLSEEETTEDYIFSDTQIAASGQSLFYTPFPYRDNSLLVFNNGVYQTKDVDYEEISPSGISFYAGEVEEGDRISFVTAILGGGISKYLKDYSFVTVYKYTDLPNALDLETHHVLHDEINHDIVPISDPGDKYSHTGEYKILSDHIYDDIAHGLAESITFRWKIINGTTAEKFALQISTIPDFSDILGDYDSSTVTDDIGIFEYYAGEIPWALKYSSSYYSLSDACSISGLGVDIDGVYYTTTSDGCLIKSDESGNSISVIDITHETRFCAITVCSNTIYLGGFNGDLYYSTDVGWEYVQTNAARIYSLGVWRDGTRLVIGGDGEVYEREEDGTLTKIVDIPVFAITGLIEYGGVLFIGAAGGNGKVYRYDGGNVVLDYDFEYYSNSTKFCIFEGKLYVSIGRKLYYKEGLTSTWTLAKQFTYEIRSIVVHEGVLYVGTTRGVYYLSDGDWIEDYDFGSYDAVILASYGESLFAGQRKKIYLRHGNLGWVKVPATGVDSTVFNGREVRFTLKSIEEIRALKKAGLVYLRYKQYPTDDVWYYYPPTETDEKVKADSGDPTTGYLNAKVQNSITVDTSAHKLQLVNDSISPGASKYYGTNSGGTKGFFNLPTKVSDLTNDLGFITDAPSDNKLYGRKNASWQEISDGGGGVSTFLELTDTPSSYTDEKYKITRVNSDETAIVFGSLAEYDSDEGTLEFVI